PIPRTRRLLWLKMGPAAMHLTGSSLLSKEWGEVHLAELRTRKSALHRSGIQDMFGESGTADEPLNKHNLDPDGIIESVFLIMKSYIL
ncbi:MAG: hypothetical protein WBC70_04810, partial [Candidatus Aminicenantales bacterium]